MRYAPMIARLDPAPGLPTLPLRCSATIVSRLRVSNMKAWLSAGAAILVAASTLAPMARAEGPRPSSENNWPGIGDTAGTAATVPSADQTAPHYVWQEGYDRGGKWHGHWVLVR